MFIKSRRLFFFLIPVFIGIAIYPISFDGKQVLSINAPLISTFDVLVNDIWKFHPFIVHINELEKMNQTCSYYEIKDEIPLFKINIPTVYYVKMNIDRINYCITSIIQTQMNVMNGYHQYCMHINTLKPTTTIITDQFYGKTWMILNIISEKICLYHINIHLINYEKK